jgi:hypothetical protein
MAKTRFCSTNGRTFPVISISFVLSSPTPLLASFAHIFPAFVRWANQEINRCP